MKVLMISDVYLPRINGVSTSISTFRKEFRKNGHSVVLVAPDYGPSPDEDENIIRIPSRRVVIDPEDRLMWLSSLRRLADRLGSFHPDIVHIQTPFMAHYAGVKLSRKFGVPCVETYHTFFEEYLHHYAPFAPGFLTRFMARILSRIQCNEADGIVVPSTAMFRVLKEYGVRSRMAVIPTGLDLDGWVGGNGRRFRSQRGIDDASPVLVHLGRLAFEKNIDFLFDVLVKVKESFPDIVFILAGEGPAEPHLVRTVARLGLQKNVVFTGNLHRREDLWDCYSAGDVFVFASRTETQGLVLLEAMALGVPVVSTAVLGTLDILEPRRGAVVAREEIDDFASKVVALLRDRDLRAKLGREGREYVGNWTSSAMAERLLQFYQSVASSPRPSPMLLP